MKFATLIAWPRVLLGSTALVFGFNRLALADMYVQADPNSVLRYGGVLKTWDKSVQPVLAVADCDKEKLVPAPISFKGAHTRITLEKSSDRSTFSLDWNARASVKNLVASASIDTGGTKTMTTNSSDLVFSYYYDSIASAERLTSDFVGNRSTRYSGVDAAMSKMSGEGGIASTYGDVVVVGEVKGRSVAAKMSFHFVSSDAAESFYASLSGSYSIASLSAAMKTLATKSHSSVRVAVEAVSATSDPLPAGLTGFDATDADALQVKITELEKWADDQIKKADSDHTVGWIVEEFTDFKAYPAQRSVPGFPEENDLKAFQERLKDALKMRRELGRAERTNWYTVAGKARRKELYKTADKLVKDMCETFRKMDSKKGKLDLDEFDDPYEELVNGLSDVIPTITVRNNNVTGGAGTPGSQTAKTVFGCVDFGPAAYFVENPDPYIYYVEGNKEIPLAYDEKTTDDMIDSFNHAYMWPSSVLFHIWDWRPAPHPEVYFQNLYNQTTLHTAVESARKHRQGDSAHRVALFYFIDEFALSTLRAHGYEDEFGDGIPLEMRTKPMAGRSQMRVVSIRCGDQGL